MPLIRKAAFASSTFALLLFTLLLFPMEARADVIQITSGHVFIGGAPLSRNAWRAINFNFSGNNFNAAGGTGDGEGRQQVQSPCGGALLCQPGTSVTPNSTAILQTFGVATFNGTTVGSWWIGSGSTLNFTGPDVVIPDAAGQSFTLTTPFAMTGSVFVHSLDDINHPLVFSTDVSGQGIATLTFTYFNFTPTTNGYVLSSIRYDFTPIPEPATMILLGTGLAGIAARGYKRRQVRKQSDS
jgi:PEP-CTERM motif